ncbi:MAG: multi-sensor hybrid histidine kinase [Verrucomicrobia bacterium]|nr:multi-sensor hybrid histidine kinase [Verrucomicrobiota bacterium]
MTKPISVAPFPADYVADDALIARRFAGALDQLRSRTNRFFAKLLVVQWLATVALALIVSPKAWEGRIPTTHIHVWAAIFLGGAISLYPAWLGWSRSGLTQTRHAQAAAQMLMSALLIHLTGGRIETHFHVFGSLALLALYRDIRVFATATLIVYVDHLARGWFWPESVYGVLTTTVWRSLEHAGWVLFEVTFLSMTVAASLREMRELVARQIGLEKLNRDKDQVVQTRTHELARSEEQFRAFFNDSPVGLYRATPAGDFIAVNPALLKILGFPSFEALRTAWHSAPGFDGGRAQFLAELSVTDEVLRRDAVWRRQDDRPLHIRETGRAFRDATGKMEHIDGTIDDVTEHRQLEERYLQSQKVQAIGQLAGGVAHDFNNILTVIAGYTHLLLRDPKMTEPLRHGLDQIRIAGVRASGLTGQLLAFSRKQHLQPRVIHLNAVAAEMDSMLQRLVGENIRIRTVGVSGLAAVRADPGQIQQVLMNLVVNARDAMMPKGGLLTIETANVVLGPEYTRIHHDLTPGSYVMLAVSDTGVGMSPEVQARLFEPFFTTKIPGQGTGLGLATCHGIIKQSGGHIAAYSEVGHGTTFKVYLPAVDAEASAEIPAPLQDERRGAGEMILLVEDDRTVRELGCELLTSLGYKVVLSANGLEALDRFKEYPQISLVITDTIMPHMGGRELVSRIHEFAPRLPVLFTSGYTFDALGETGEVAPGCHFMAKPYDPAVMARKIDDCFAESRS